MRVAIHDLYRRRTDHLEGEQHEVEAELAQRWPAICAEVDPDDGLDELLEHLNRSLQGFSFEEQQGLSKAEYGRPLGISRAMEASDRYGEWHEGRTGELEPDCRDISVSVARELHHLGHRVSVVSGKAVGDDEADGARAGKHWWLEVDGRHFDPKSHVVGVGYSSYKEKSRYHPEDQRLGAPPVAKMQPAPSFPKLGVEDRRETDLVSTDRQVAIKQGLAYNHSQATRGRGRASYSPDVWSRGKERLAESHAESRGFSAAAASVSRETGKTDARYTSYARSQPLEPWWRGQNGPLATQQHEGFHAMLDRVGVKYGQHAQRQLVQHLWEELPKKYRGRIEDVQAGLTGSTYTGQPSETEEKLARLLNYVNDPAERDRFHRGHGEEIRRLYGATLKRSLQIVRAAARRADKSWLRPGPLKKGEVIQFPSQALRGATIHDPADWPSTGAFVGDVLRVAAGKPEPTAGQVAAARLRAGPPALKPGDAVSRREAPPGWGKVGEAATARTGRVLEHLGVDPHLAAHRYRVEWTHPDGKVDVGDEYEHHLLGKAEAKLAIGRLQGATRAVGIAASGKSLVAQPQQATASRALALHSGEVELPGGYRLSCHADPGQNSWTVMARDRGGDPVGEAQFAATFRAPLEHEDQNHLVQDGLKGWQVDVHPGHRRRGIATAMYRRAAEAFGMPVREGDFQTPSGRAFADSLRKAVSDSSAFKAWFGDSRVTHPDGRPVTAYHGTNPAAPFSEFKVPEYGRNELSGLGAWFAADPGVANNFAMESRTEYYYIDPEMRREVVLPPGEFSAPGKTLLEVPVHYRDGPGSQVMPVHLSLRNPLVLESHPERGDALDQLRQMRHRHATYYGGEQHSWKSRMAEKDRAGSTKAFRDELIAAGHDGIVLRGTRYDADDGKAGDQFVAFHPHQVKSATGNSGAFDPKDPDIAKSMGDGDQESFDRETAKIVEGRSTPEGRAAHDFRAARWTHSNGHPRCRLCGDEERTGGRCRGADADGLGPRGHLPLAKREVPAPDPRAWDFSPGGPEDMCGLDPDAHRALSAAAFLAGGAAPHPREVRRWLRSSSDLEGAALSAFGLADTEENRAALRAAGKALESAGQLRKAEGEPELDYSGASPLLPSSEGAAKAVRRAAAEGELRRVQLGGKHSAGSVVAAGQPDLLLKPGSGPQSPAAGAREDPSSQSRREAAFYRLAEAMGLGDWVPRAELLLAAGREVAAIELLPAREWKNASKVAKRDPGRFLVDLERYRVSGVLHRWACLDYAGGNPDRHNQNLMISRQGEFRLIDHGSAFAGASFDPAHDGDSFVPFYLRPSAPGDFHRLPPTERLRHMVSATPEADEGLREWLAGLDPRRIELAVFDAGIDPSHVLERLARLRALPPNASEAVNRIWALG